MPKGVSPACPKGSISRAFSNMVTIGYTFTPKDWRFLDRIRVYGTMKNVFTLTGFSGVDPSTYQVNGLTPGGQGSRTYFPSTRQIIVGMQLDF